MTGENPSRINTEKPEWIKLSESAFNFLDDSKDLTARRADFCSLLKTMVQPLTEADMEVAPFQYTLLLRRMETMIEEAADDQCTPTLKSLMYRICTDPKLYTLQVVSWQSMSCCSMLVYLLINVALKVSYLL